MDCDEQKECLFVDSQEWDFQAADSSKRVDLLMLRNSVFTVRKVEIWSELSSNEVNLLMLRNRIFRLRIVQKYEVSSRKGVNLLMLRRRVLGCETFRYGQCRHERTSNC